MVYILFPAVPFFSGKAEWPWQQGSRPYLWDQVSIPSLCWRIVRLKKPLLLHKGWISLTWNKQPRVQNAAKQIKRLILPLMEQERAFNTSAYPQCWQDCEFVSRRLKGDSKSHLEESWAWVLPGDKCGIKHFHRQTAEHIKHTKISLPEHDILKWK